MAGGLTLGDLETALKLEATGDQQWHGRADPAYEGNTGMYGGFTAALLLKSIVSEPSVQGAPSALTVNFIKAVPAGSDVILRTRLLGATRSIQNWVAELSISGNGDVCALATVVTTSRREVEGFIHPVMPEVPAPEQVEPTIYPSKFGRQSPVRPVLGMDFSKGSHLGRTHSAQWIREISGRRIDAVQVAYLCDNYPPRPFFTSKGLRPSSTVAYSVYFVATPEEIAAVGEDFTLIDVIGTRAVNGTAGSRVNLWSRAGTLLATSEQLCWYR
ncbi:MAG: thioesterase family protein [Micropepsaceae bacterium]